MTRIIAGNAGGRRLRTPAGLLTRPTADRVREALFSAVESRLGGLAGRRFLDVYAGSGAVGLEAGSRGAVHVTMVEQELPAAALIRANAAQLGMQQIVTVIAGRAERVVASGAGPLPGSPFDVAFLDPPYELATDQLCAVISDLAQSGSLTSDALLVVERARRGDAWRWPDPVQPVRDKRYGESMLWYGQLAHHVAEEQ